MSKLYLWIIIGLIVFFGLTSRLFTFQTAHPDNDELFELKSIEVLKMNDIFKRNTFYGDHTSFPGEYLLQYLPMKALNLFDHPAHIDIEARKIQGISKQGFWILAVPKILLCLLSLWIFYLICRDHLRTDFGFIIAFLMLMFNSHLIYHAFSLRPYGVLTELSIISLYLASQDNKSVPFAILHGLVAFFICIYHAYGPLIALLPILVARKERAKEMIPFVVVGLMIWVYYAAYSNMGMSPNKVQSVVDTFQFITKENFINGVLDSIFGGSVLMLAVIPFVLIGLQNITKSLIKYFLLLILVPMALIMLVDIKTHYWIHPRQYIWLMPTIALWCAMMCEVLYTGGTYEKESNIGKEAQGTTTEKDS